MLHGAISLVLTTVMLACPLLCGTEACREAAPESPACCGCCREDARPVRIVSLPALPQDPAEPGSGPECQCLCAGAVLARHDGPMWPLEASVGPVASAASDPLFLPTSAAPAEPIPTGKGAPGRRLRCLYSSYLC